MEFPDRVLYYSDFLGIDPASETMLKYNCDTELLNNKSKFQSFESPL